MKKNCIWLVALILFVMPGFAQSVAINEDGSLPNNKAILDIKSSKKGVLIPRMSTAERISILAPQGLLVYDTTTNSFWYSTGLNSNNTASLWQNLATGAWSLSGNNVDNNAFLGTTSGVLNIRVNNQPSGRITPLSYGSTYWGYLAGFSDSAGSNGTRNTAFGTLALYSNTYGYANTASGGEALYFNTTGVGNTATGFQALYSNTTGNGNTGIGNNAGVSSGNLSNATAIGNGATVNASNKVRIGNSSVTVIEGAVPFTSPSDGRFKFQVKEDVKGLDFILQLRPVTYQFDVKRFDAQYSKADNSNESPNGNYALQASYDEAARIRRSGFIAQEVEKAAMASGYNFSGIIQPKTEKEHYSLSYESFVVPLVKAMQELNAKVEKLEKENETLKQLLNSKK